MTAADDLYPLLFGNVALDGWPDGDELTEMPWSAFITARRHLANGDVDLAIRSWGPVATLGDWDSRHRIQAWKFLRAQGIVPDESIAREVLGVVAEVPVAGRHDVLAAYADGTIRYLNHAGSVIVIESPSPEQARRSSELLAVGAEVVAVLGPWTEPELPTVDPGSVRFTMLTPSGPHFGQGPEDVMAADPRAGRLFEAATALLVAVLEDANG